MASVTVTQTSGEPFRRSRSSQVRVTATGERKRARISPWAFQAAGSSSRREGRLFGCSSGLGSAPALRVAPLPCAASRHLPVEADGKGVLRLPILGGIPELQVVFQGIEIWRLTARESLEAVVGRPRGTREQAAGYLSGRGFLSVRMAPYPVGSIDLHPSRGRRGNWRRTPRGPRVPWHLSGIFIASDAITSFMAIADCGDDGIRASY